MKTLFLIAMALSTAAPFPIAAQAPPAKVVPPTPPAAVVPAPAPAAPAADPAAPVISDAHQKTYWRDLSAYNAADAEYQRSVRAATLAEQFMGEQKKKIAGSRGALESDCGDKYTLDLQQFQKGECLCQIKPPTPGPAKTAIVPTVPGPAAVKK